MADFEPIATLDQVPPGGKLLVDVDGRAIAVFNVAGTLYAIDDVCTHDGGPLAEGEFVGHTVQCPRHGALFDVRTGAALTMPAFEPVATHEIKVEGNQILVRLNED